ncbi:MULTISPECIES: hypothetical protein [unclassified Microcoleus]|uniref:hypothetical protein n=1 Tax=unclassified Microcoleus TaxID=2642155 RepID=UPI002FD253FF
MLKTTLRTVFDCRSYNKSFMAIEYGRGLSKSIRNLDRQADAYTRTHLEETRDRISKVLNAQIQSN